jgi:hypothetical protein
VIGDNHKVTAAPRADLHPAVLMQVVFANSESAMILGGCKSESGNIRAYRPVLSPLPTAFRTPTFTYQLLADGFCFLEIVTCSGIRLCGLVLFQPIRKWPVLESIQSKALRKMDVHVMIGHVRRRIPFLKRHRATPQMPYLPGAEDSVSVSPP